MNGIQERRFMLNQIIIVGVLKELPQLKETTSSIKYATLTLKVQRNFRNSEGAFEADIIHCTLWRGIAENCIDICKVGDVIAVKGRIQSHPYTTDDKVTYMNYEIIAEKVSFLQTSETI